MVYGMSSYPHCVVLERSVYVGGGVIGYGGDDEYYIQVFNMKLTTGVVYQDMSTNTLL